MWTKFQSSVLCHPFVSVLLGLLVHFQDFQLSELLGFRGKKIPKVLKVPKGGLTFVTISSIHIFPHDLAEKSRTFGIGKNKYRKSQHCFVWFWKLMIKNEKGKISISLISHFGFRFLSSWRPTWFRASSSGNWIATWLRRENRSNHLKTYSWKCPIKTCTSLRMRSGFARTKGRASRKSLSSGRVTPRKLGSRLPVLTGRYVNAYSYFS